MKRIKIASADRRDEPMRSILEILRRLDQKTTAIWAADCAEHVLFLFEGKIHHDSRPRRAIETNRAWIKRKITVRECRTAAFAAHDAARFTEDAAARAAAKAAGYAAAAAHVAGHAIHAVTYAAASVAYDNEADPEAARKKETEWQYRHLLELVEKNMYPFGVSPS